MGALRTYTYLYGQAKQASKHYHTLLAGGLWPALTHPYKHGSRRDLWISSNSHKGKSVQRRTLSPLSDASIAALVRTAAARRGRTRKCEIGIGTGGGGACLKPSGASPLRGTLQLVNVILPPCS